MNLLFRLFIVLVLPINIFAQNRLNILIPTSAEETDYVWRTIRDIQFFEEHNYSLSLPQSELMDSLLARSRSQRLSDSDYEALKKWMGSTVYQKEDYLAAYEKLEEQRALINKMANKISKSKRDWKFKEFDRYSVRLTLYGSGGSYNPDDGSIIIFATTDGRFKQYDNPANTIIHEITHIGVEESIIAKYQVPHALKERIIDKFVLLQFEKYLPEYRLQNMGDERIDQYLNSKKDLAQLDKIVEQFQQNN